MQYWFQWRRKKKADNEWVIWMLWIQDGHTSDGHWVREQKKSHGAISFIEWSIFRRKRNRMKMTHSKLKSEKE